MQTKTKKNNLIESSKYLGTKKGYRQGMSTVTAATYFVESVIKAIDCKRRVLAVMMGLTKAFNRVCHIKLIQELKKCGIRRVRI